MAIAKLISDFRTRSVSSFYRGDPALFDAVLGKICEQNNVPVPAVEEEKLTPDQVVVYSAMFGLTDPPVFRSFLGDLKKGGLPVNPADARLMPIPVAEQVDHCIAVNAHSEVSKLDIETIPSMESARRTFLARLREANPPQVPQEFRRRGEVSPDELRREITEMQKNPSRADEILAQRRKYPRGSKLYNAAQLLNNRWNKKIRGAHTATDTAPGNAESSDTGTVISIAAPAEALSASVFSTHPFSTGAAPAEAFAASVLAASSIPTVPTPTNEKTLLEDLAALAVYDHVIAGTSTFTTPGAMLTHVMDNIYHVVTGQVAQRGSTDDNRLHDSQVSNWRNDKALKTTSTSHKGVRPVVPQHIARGLGYEDGSLMQECFLQALYKLARTLKKVESKTAEQIYASGEIDSFPMLVKRLRASKTDPDYPMASMSASAYQRALASAGIMMGVERAEYNLSCPNDFVVREFAKHETPGFERRTRDLAVVMRTKGKSMDEIVFGVSPADVPLALQGETASVAKEPAKEIPQEYIREHLQTQPALAARLAAKDFKTIFEEIIKAADIAVVPLTDRINRRRAEADPPLVRLPRNTVAHRWSHGQFDKEILAMALDEIDLTVPQRGYMEALWEEHNRERGGHQDIRYITDPESGRSKLRAARQQRRDAGHPDPGHGPAQDRDRKADVREDEGRGAGDSRAR